MKAETTMQSDLTQEKTSNKDAPTMEVAAKPEIGLPGMGQTHNLQACGGVLHFEAITETK